MTKRFILQGFTERTHKEAIHELFDVPKIQHVIFSVAYVSESGVEHVEKKLKANASKLSIYAGIRNEITSHQGISRLLKVNARELYAVDTGSYGTTFHPKLYLVRGETTARLLIGSANLTLGGLNNNIEASVLHHLDLATPSDKALVEEIEGHFVNLPQEDDYKDHFILVKDQEKLDEFLKQGRLVDEDFVRPPRQPSKNAGTGESDGLPLIKLKVTRLKKTPKKAAASPKPEGAEEPKQGTGKKVGGTAPPPATPAEAAPGAVYEAVWESKPLSRRSLNIKTEGSTNPTGSTTLGKGLMSDIDPVTYFRQDIFGHLPWEYYVNRAGNPAQKVDTQFDIFIKGVNEGRFVLTLRHSLTREEAAEDDKNLPTELSWNEAKAHIAQEDLLGRTLTLLRDVNDPNHFAVSID